VARSAGIQLRISSSVLLGAAALGGAALVLAVATPGSADVPRIIALGVLFWVAGWLCQAATYVLASGLLGQHVSELSLGVLGVRVGPQRWEAWRGLVAALATLASLVLLGFLFWGIEAGNAQSPLIRADASDWTWPSIGFSEHDSIWKSAAWLCWSQALFQLYPLPRSLGRQMLTAFASIGIGRLEHSRQVVIVRRCLEVIALSTLLATIIWSMKFQPTMDLRGLLLVALSWLLFVSSRGADVGQILSGFQVGLTAKVSERGDHGVTGREPLERFSGLIDRLRQRRRFQKLRQAQQREREEAIDSQRLDEILSRLHREGRESLSPDDRRVLERVSESLRRQRQERASGHPATDDPV
jgi:hypothetical protein